MKSFNIEITHVVHAAVPQEMDFMAVARCACMVRADYCGESYVAWFGVAVDGDDSDINCMMCLSGLNTAELVKNFDNSQMRSRASLYRLSIPLEGHTHIIVSAASVLGEPETYIFGADEDGTCTDWSELYGSFKGDLNHARALANAGYRIVK